jgi:hypothetical protein
MNSRKLIVKITQQRGVSSEAVEALRQKFDRLVNKLDSAVVDAAIAEYKTAAANPVLFDEFRNSCLPLAWDSIEKIAFRLYRAEQRKWVDPSECGLLLEVEPA